MNIRFLPEGGFNKSGAFIEYDGSEPSGDEPEYERQGYISVSLVCDEFEAVASADIINEYEEPNNPNRDFQKVIFGTARIEGARWSVFTLSFLGQKKETSDVKILIRSSGVGEASTFSGILFEGDLDLEDTDEFFLEINVHQSRFHELLTELSQPGAKIRIRAVTHKFGNFYATWSPSISEGRVIKFLDSRNDVENADEIPEEFWPTADERKELLSDADSPPVTISVVRPLHLGDGMDERVTHSQVDSDYESDHLDEMPTTSRNREGLLVKRNNALLAQLDATAILASRVRRAGIWISFWLAVLAVATLLSSGH